MTLRFYVPIQFQKITKTTLNKDGNQNYCRSKLLSLLEAQINKDLIGGDTGKVVNLDDPFKIRLDNLKGT